jgi:hypothetical protein
VKTLLLLLVLAGCDYRPPLRCCARRAVASDCSCWCAGETPELREYPPREKCVEWAYTDAGSCP